MNMKTNGNGKSKVRLISMRLIVTAASVLLIAAAVITVGGVASSLIGRF